MSTPFQRTVQLARLRLACARDPHAVEQLVASLGGYAEALRDHELISRAEHAELSRAIAAAANGRLAKLREGGCQTLQAVRA